MTSSKFGSLASKPKRIARIFLPSLQGGQNHANQRPVVGLDEPFQEGDGGRSRSQFEAQRNGALSVSEL